MKEVSQCKKTLPVNNHLDGLKMDDGADEEGYPDDDVEIHPRWQTIQTFPESSPSQSLMLAL